MVNNQIFFKGRNCHRHINEILEMRETLACRLFEETFEFRQGDSDKEGWSQ